MEKNIREALCTMALNLGVGDSRAIILHPDAIQELQTMPEWLSSGKYPEGLEPLENEVGKIGNVRYFAKED